MNFKATFLAMVGALGVSSASQAATYNFDVIYSGGGTANLAPGSDDMLNITFTTGDVINYSFTAAGSGLWQTTSAGGPSIINAPGDLYGNFGQVDFDYSYAFNLNGVAQSFGSGSGSQGNADLGPRQIFYPAGLSFNNFSETLDITSIGQAGQFYSLLPAWPGKSLESSGSISFSASPAVPEPRTWAMMLVGFGMVGFAMRKRNVRTTVSYA